MGLSHFDTWTVRREALIEQLSRKCRTFAAELKVEREQLSIKLDIFHVLNFELMDI